MIDLWLTKASRLGHFNGMPESHVLIEASGAYATAASDLLTAAHFKPVLEVGKKHHVSNILHQIAEAVIGLTQMRPIDEVVHLVQTEMETTRNRHEGRRVVFFMPQVSGDLFVKVVAAMGRTLAPSPYLELANTIPDAVAQIIHRARANGQSAPIPKTTFALDAVPGMDAVGDDLRDDETGRLNAKKVSELFDVKMTAIAEAAAITKQGLDQNPNSEKAQPVLRNFERIARLRTHPQFRDPAKLRKWFRKPLPLFSNHSAEDLFKAGKLETVATKVDQMLSGDFGG